MPPLPSTNLILLPHVCSLSLKLCFRRLCEYFSFVFKPYRNIWKALRLHNYCNCTVRIKSTIGIKNDSNWCSLWSTDNATLCSVHWSEISQAGFFNRMSYKGCKFSNLGTSLRIYLVPC